MHEVCPSRSHFTTDDRSVGRSVCLGVGHHFGAHGQVFLFPFFCLKIALLLENCELWEQRSLS
jgi:hypothetical protein